MRRLVESIEAEYRRYKALAEGAMHQLSEEQMCERLGDGDNSVATIAWHVAGNLRSRFTDFLTADGEKEWRDRESEFLPRSVPRNELLSVWEQGWAVLWNALEGLGDEDLERRVVIRGLPLSVAQALHRSLTHTSYHAGQIVFLGKHLKGADWSYQSIPPGQSVRYNANPTLEAPPARDAGPHPLP